MDDTRLLSTSPTIKTVCSPLNTNNFRQRFDTTSVIQQSDVSSSRPALLAHDALGPLLFEALDGFFFTINHNFELDFVSDNVAQYLRFSQEELAGRNLYQCVHPNDVTEFSKTWAKNDAGENNPNTELNNVQSRGRTFHCRMRMNDESTPYARMVVSVALHCDSSASDKTFLICIARRPSLNDPKDKPSVLGFDQFSSRINLNYDIESLDSSHMKCEIIDPNYTGRNFRDCVHISDVSSIEQHFQEVIEDGEGKSAVYRFCLHDDVYAFINTRSKLFSNSTTNESAFILSTHTIVRLIESNNDLSGSACTRLMKSIISSNRDLQRQKSNNSTKSMTNSSSTPIGTQFALAMLGMHRNASNSLQQHVSSTLGTLMQVQSSFTTPNQSSPSEKSQTPQIQNQFITSPSTSNNRSIAQKFPLIDNVSSTDTVEFGSKQKAMSPSLESIHSNPNPSPSPFDSLDLLLQSTTPINSNDANLFLPSTAQTKTSSTSFQNNEIYNTTTTSKVISTSQILPSHARSSTRLRQLLTNKSPSTNENPSQIIHYHPDELLQEPESPTSTHLSPLFTDLSSPVKRRRKPATNSNEQNNSADVLLKKILERQSSASTSPNRAESIHSDDSSSNGQTTNKQRSDTYLRTLLNDEVRPQKVLVEAPFVYGTRSKLSQELSADGVKPNVATLKSQLSLPMHSNSSNDMWNNKSKKKPRQHSNSFGSQTNATPRKPGRPKRDPSDYLLTTPSCQTPQSILSDGSLDALLDSTMNMEQTTTQNSPIAIRHATRQTSTHHVNHSVNNCKRSADHDDPSQNARKYPKLLTQALQDEVKVEYQDHSMNSSTSSSNVTAMRMNHPPLQTTIKSEPEIFDALFNNKTISSFQSQTSRTTNLSNSSSNNNQTTILRSLIRTAQPAVLPAKKDAPLYDLLQNISSTNSNETSSYPSAATGTNSIDPLEQYLTPVLSQTSTNNTLPSSDDYLASLLSSDPQKPSELALSQIHKSQVSTDNNRFAAAYDLCHGTNNTTSVAATPSTTAVSMSTINHSNDDFLSLLENKDFLECLNESSTIDSILSQNSTSVIEPLFPSSVNKRSEKDEKAISEIYKKLVNSLNPGSNQQSSTAPTNMDQLPSDNSPFNFLPGDFFSTENTHSYPPNRTVTVDPVGPVYRQNSAASAKNYSYSSNNNQFSDCLSTDSLDNGTYPPNVTLSPMNNTFLPTTPVSTGTTPMMNTNPMMMCSQAPPPPVQTLSSAAQSHVQHHTPSNGTYRPAQQLQTSPYNNFIPTPQNPMTQGYYSMSPQPRMSAHQPSLVKRPQFIHQQQPLQHRSMAPMNQYQQQQQQQQQLQLHMSMNVTLPHMTSNQQQQQHHQQPSQMGQPQQQQMSHRPMMNNYNEYMMTNNNGPPLQPDYQHQYSTNNPMDLPYGSDLFMQSPSTMGQQTIPNRHMSMMQQQAPPPVHPHHAQQTMHQPYSNMSVALSATIQQNSHNPNNLMNSSLSPSGPGECRQPDEITNHMMHCLSFQPAHCNREFVRKQLQSTIHSRQKPAAGKDLSGSNSLAATLDSNQKGAYFRSQLSTPPLPNAHRTQPTLQHSGKPAQ